MQLVLGAIFIIGFIGYLIGVLLFSGSKNQESKEGYAYLFAIIFTIAALVYLVKWYFKHEAIKACETIDSISINDIAGTWQGEPGIYTFENDSTFQLISKNGEKYISTFFIESNFIRFTSTKVSNEVRYTYKICCVNKSKMQFRYIDKEGDSGSSNIKLERID